MHHRCTSSGQAASDSTHKWSGSIRQSASLSPMRAPVRGWLTLRQQQTVHHHQGMYTLNYNTAAIGVASTQTLITSNMKTLRSSAILQQLPGGRDYETLAGEGTILTEHAKGSSAGHLGDHGMSSTGHARQHSMSKQSQTRVAVCERLPDVNRVGHVYLPCRSVI